MRRFLMGLMLGIAATYWYAYQKDAFMTQMQTWFAEASADPDAPAKTDKMFSRHR